MHVLPRLSRSWLVYSLIATGVVGASSGSARAERMTAADIVKVPAEPGAPTVGPFKPTWCDAMTSDISFHALAQATKGEYIWDQLPKAVTFACAEPDSPVFHQQIGMYMQRWANLTGASAAQLGEFLALRADAAKWDAQHDATCTKLEPLEDAPARDIKFREMERKVMGCGPNAPMHLNGPEMMDREGFWHLDRKAELPSQLVGLYRMLTCFPGDKPGMWDLSRWAVCRLDLATLDPAKLEKELKAGGFNDYARIIALQAMSTAKLEATRLEAAFQAKIAKDAEFKAVLVDAPKKGWSDWEAGYAAQRSAIDAAWAYEDKFYGTRKSAAKGCLASVENHLQLATGTRTGKTTEGVGLAATSGVGPILLEQLRQCHAAEGNAAAVAAVSQLIAWGQPVRGPRTAALVAMSAAAVAVLDDRPKFEITGDMMKIDLVSPGELGQGHRLMGSTQYAGEVKAVTKKGDRVFVTFKTVSWTENERECTPTGQILQWRPDGTPLYGENCRYTGKKLKLSSTAEPFWTVASHAAGIKPGVFVKYSTGTERVDDVFDGIAGEVWKTKEQKVLIAALGVLTK